MQHQQEFNSNHGQSGVCQSAPTVGYHQGQIQSLVDPNTGLQNMPSYGASTGMPQQQPAYYSNTQHQHMHQHQHPHTHHQYPQTQQLGTAQYQQHMYQHHQNMQQYQQRGASQQQQLLIKPPQTNNGILPEDDEEEYDEERYITDPYHTVREEQQEPNVATRCIQHQSAQQNLSQPHFARPASSYPAVSTQPQQMQATHQHPQQFTQPAANYATSTMAPYRSGGTGVHQHMVTSPFEQMGASQQIASPQQISHSHSHVCPQQMQPSEQTQQFVPPKTASPQQVSWLQPAEHSQHHHHMHPQTVPAQQSVVSQSAQQQVGSSQQPHQYYDEYPRQRVSSQLTQQVMAPQETSLPPQVASPQYATHSHHHHHVHPEQTVASSLQTAQAHSTPTVAPGQHHLIQSMPGLQAGQGNVQYQQYIQPLNTEQPVQVPGQNASFAPYQYYDSSSAKMQTVYAQPHGSSSRTAHVHGTQQSPNAAGDMASTQKSPVNYRGGLSSRGSDYPLEERRRPQAAVCTPRKKVQDTVGSLIQGQAGQMPPRKTQQHGKPFNG